MCDLPQCTKKFREGYAGRFCSANGTRPICGKRGYLLWFVPQEQLRLATPQADLATYTFNTGRVRHHFCPHCGCAPFGVGSDKKGVARAAINVRCA